MEPSQKNINEDDRHEGGEENSTDNPYDWSGSGETWGDEGTAPNFNHSNSVTPQPNVYSYPPPVTPPTSSVQGSGNLAGFWVRVGYSLVDSIIMFVALVPVYLIFTIPNLANTTMTETANGEIIFSANATAAFVWTSILAIIIPTAYILLTCGFMGRTLGQKIFETEIVLENGVSVKNKWGVVSLRTLLMLVLSSIPIVGLIDYLWCIWDEKKQTLHDKIAGTLVIYRK